MSNQTNKNNSFPNSPPPKNKTQISCSGNQLFGWKTFQACAATLICRWGVRPSNSEEILVSWRWRKTHGVKSQERLRHRTSNNLYSITIRTRRFYVEKFHQNHPKSVLRIKKNSPAWPTRSFFPTEQKHVLLGEVSNPFLLGPSKISRVFLLNYVEFQGCKL